MRLYNYVLVKFVKVVYLNCLRVLFFFIFSFVIFLGDRMAIEYIWIFWIFDYREIENIFSFSLIGYIYAFYGLFFV